MTYSMKDYTVLERCWRDLNRALNDRFQQLGPVGESGQFCWQAEAGLVAFAIENFQNSSHDRNEFVALVEKTWEALEQQQDEPREERERRKREYRWCDRESTEAFRASLAADVAGRREQFATLQPGYVAVPVRWEDLPPHAPSVARFAADSSGKGAEPAQQHAAVLEPSLSSAAGRR